MSVSVCPFRWGEEQPPFLVEQAVGGVAALAENGLHGLLLFVWQIVMYGLRPHALILLDDLFPRSVRGVVGEV